MNVALLVTVIVAILSVARTARLIVWDDYPPMQWLTSHWDRWTGYVPGRGGWGKLMHCAFCAAPYLSLGMFIWTASVRPWGNPWDYWSADWWWFAANGVWGCSYLASILVAWDQPPGDD